LQKKVNEVQVADQFGSGVIEDKVDPGGLEKLLRNRVGVIHQKMIFFDPQGVSVYLE